MKSLRSEDYYADVTLCMCGGTMFEVRPYLIYLLVIMYGKCFASLIELEIFRIVNI